MRAHTRREPSLLDEKLFLSAADFSISSKWVKQTPNYVIESFAKEEPPVIFLGSGFGKEAIPPQKTDEELAKDLRNELGLKDNSDNLSELLQYLKNQAGSGRTVIDWLKRNLGYGSSEPGGAYRLLLALPCNAFLTTSYDSLLSDTSIQMGYRLINVDYPSSFSSTYADIRSRPKTGLLGRLRGTFDNQENLIATTDDYISEVTSGHYRWRELIREYFRTRQVIFIGYSLKDFTMWTSYISVFNESYRSVYSPVLVAPADSSSDYAFFWNKYNIRFVPLKAYQFLIAIHDQLGTLEKDEGIAISAVASCLGKTYDEAKKEVEMQRKRWSYPSLIMTAIKIITDYFHRK